MTISASRRVMSVLAALLVSGATLGAQAAKPPFPLPWINAAHGPEPEMQVQRYDADTFVVRQSIHTNVEGPFIYLFFGTDRVLEVDTGAGGLKIGPTIDRVISDWIKGKGLASIQHVVVHSHSHDDHVAGDSEFAGRPNTIVVGHSPKQVAEFFKIGNWPEETVPFDLGGRIVDVIPAPGHEPAEVALFDRRTRLLLTGDELYPGRLYVATPDFETDKRSIDRIVDFTRSKHVSWVLGCHIEMTLTPGRDFAFHAASHPLERRLELPYSDLLELQSILHKMGDQPRLAVRKDFIFYPLP